MLALGATAFAARAESSNVFADAKAYERFMGRWSRLVAPRFLSFAGIGEATSVLDVGCGTGALALEIAARNRKALVMGMDLSKEYIAYDNQQNHDERVRFEAGDAQHMLFPDGSFDAVVSLLALNFIPQPQQVLAEMRRVTRPKGRIAAAVWDYGDGMQMLRAFWDAAIASDPAAEGTDEKHMPLCREGELRNLWTRAGLEHVNEKPIEVEMRFQSFDDYWDPFLLGQGPAGAYVKRLSAEKVGALRDQVRRRLAIESSGSSFRLTARVWAVRGDRPA
jgi:SAM-dependent methyltransferase